MKKIENFIESYAGIVYNINYKTSRIDILREWRMQSEAIMQRLHMHVPKIL